MATRPTSDPTWATGGSAIKVNPTAAKRQAGWTNSEKPPDGFLNYTQNSAGEWIQYLDTAHVLTANWASWTSPIGALSAYSGDFVVGWSGATPAALIPASSTFNMPRVRLANPLVAGPDTNVILSSAAAFVLTSTTSAVFSCYLSMSAAGANNNVIIAGLYGAFPNGMYFYKASADTNWKCITDSAATTTTVTTVPPVANTPQLLQIEVFGSAMSPATTARFSINGIVVATHTTNIETTDALTPTVQTQASADNAVTVDVGRLTLKW